MNKKKIIYIGILLIITVMVSITAFSYAYLTKVDEQHGKLNMTVGNLDYKIESDDLNNNSITLAANESKEIEITIRSLNQIDSKYKLYTNSVENVSIGYLDEEGFDESAGTISANGTVKVKIVLDNDSDTNKTITFGVQGGFDYNDVTLKTGRVEIEEGQALCPSGLAYEFGYTGSVQEFTAKCPGVYKLETWGAQGGSSYNSKERKELAGGKGGYSSGNINLNKNDVLYVYVGGVGANYNSSTSTVAGGYNGGGYGSNGSSTAEYGYGSGGGGATDIRLNTDSIYSRVIVAGGGGGSSSYYAINYDGNYGAGGGTTGIKCMGSSNSTAVRYDGGTQIAGGTACWWNNRWDRAENGTFGQGGNGIKTYYNGSSSIYSSNAGGGGGWYGGGAGVLTGGNGGSGWVYTESTYNNWTTNSTEGQSGNWLLNSDYYLSNATTINGNSSIPAQSGSSTMIGNTGNGYARITYLGELNVKFNTVGGTISESNRKVIYGNEIGALPTPTYTGKQFLGWYLEDTYQTKVEANYIVTSDITLYAKWDDIVITYDYLTTKPSATVEDASYNYNSNKLNITTTVVNSANLGGRVIFNNNVTNGGVVHIKGTMLVNSNSTTTKSKLSIGLGTSARGTDKGIIHLVQDVDIGSTVSFDEEFEIPNNTFVTIMIGRSDQNITGGTLNSTITITEFNVTNY